MSKKSDGKLLMWFGKVIMVGAGWVSVGVLWTHMNAPDQFRKQQAQEHRIKTDAFPCPCGAGYQQVRHRFQIGDRGGSKNVLPQGQAEL